MECLYYVREDSIEIGFVDFACNDCAVLFVESVVAENDFVLTVHYLVYEILTAATHKGNYRVVNGEAFFGELFQEEGFEIPHCFIVSSFFT